MFHETAEKTDGIKQIADQNMTVFNEIIQHPSYLLINISMQVSNIPVEALIYVPVSYETLTLIQNHYIQTPSKSHYCGNSSGISKPKPFEISFIKCFDSSWKIHYHRCYPLLHKACNDNFHSFYSLVRYCNSSIIFQRIAKMMKV